MKKIKDMEIITSFGGPCIYKRGIMPDGKETGRIQYTGQSDDELYQELISSIESGRDDVKRFVDSLGIK